MKPKLFVCRRLRSLLLVSRDYGRPASAHILQKAALLNSPSKAAAKDYSSTAWLVPTSSETQAFQKPAISPIIDLLIAFYPFPKFALTCEVPVESSRDKFDFAPAHPTIENLSLNYNPQLTLEAPTHPVSPP